MSQLLVTTTVAAGPTQFSAVPKNFRTALMIACKSANGVPSGANTGVVQIGTNSVAGHQPIIFNPGDERTFFTSAGQMNDFYNYYLVVANNGDGLMIEFS